MFDLENKVKVTEYNICSDAIRWRIPTSIKVAALVFILTVSVSEILRFNIFDLENVGQGQNAKFMQWHHSMANAQLPI